MKQIKVYITAEQWAEKRLQVYCSLNYEPELKALDKVLEKCGFELIEPETKPEQPQPNEIPTDKLEAVKYFLNQLPSGYRQRALGQVDYKRVHAREKTTSMLDAIDCFSIWSETNEGSAFWIDVQRHYQFPTTFPTLPPLPND